LDNFDNTGRKVCCKVSLYKNCQRQSCSAINCLSSGIDILAGVAPFPRYLNAKGPTRIGSTCVAHTSPYSTTLGCRSETCCTRLAEMQDAKKIAKKSPSAHHRTTLSGYIFATKAHIDNRKKMCYAAISPPHVLTIWRTSAHYK